ncbi:MAG: nitroreductase family protein [Rikenellaceae bacterium]
MEFKEVLNKRRSCRKFTEQKVSSEVIDRLLDATLTAPSSKSCNSSRFVVVTDSEKIAKLAQIRDHGAAFMAAAPLAIVVAGDTSTTDIWEINATISTTILQLACTDEGLASCWVNVINRPAIASEPDGVKAVDKLREVVDMPQDWAVLCVVAIGYGAAEAKPKRAINSEEVIINN